MTSQGNAGTNIRVQPTTCWLPMVTAQSLAYGEVRHCIQDPVHATSGTLSSFLAMSVQKKLKVAT